MASSSRVYDLALRHWTEGPDVTAFRRRLRRAGLRFRTAGHSESDGDSDSASARATVHLFGPSHDAESARIDGSSTGSALVVLGPGCRVSPRDVSRVSAPAEIVDLRSGFDADREWQKLSRTVTASADSDPFDDPERRLGPAALHEATIRSYDHIAEKFAAQWFDHPPLQPLEMFARLLPRGARVLDAGCGPGHHAKFFVGQGFDVVGVDLSSRMLDVARRRVPSVPFARMDIQHLRCGGGTFDGLWCAGAAMHVPRENLVALFAGFRRAVRPSGFVGINMQIGRRSEVVAYEGDRRFFEYYRNGDEIAELAGRAGLSIVAQDVGTTNRNTHELDLTLTWVTLVAVPRIGA